MGFQSSYEELKRIIDSTKVTMWQVFSLPMRNWNAFLYPENICTCPFSVFLWGIETILLSARLLTGLFLFSVFLWGIETPFVWGNSRKGAGFQSSYEELKRSRKTWTCCPLYHVFSLPMRNWNGPGCSRTISRKHRFQSSYEELKQFMDEGVAELINGFQSSYEELKHIKWVGGERNLPEFSVFLWGIETIFGQLLIGEGIEFSVFLWGIETFLLPAQLHCILQFSVFLWGIETWKGSGLW